MAKKSALRVLAAVITSLIIVALAAALVVIRPPQLFVDGASGRADVVHHVSQSRLEAFCPPAMTLADDSAYGDSEYRSSAGDLSTSARYAAFGSVYASNLAPLQESDGQSAPIGAETVPDEGTSLIASADGAERSSILTTDLLESNDGTGQAGAIASKATEGDLRGIASASCVTPSLSQSFLLSGTGTGFTQRLLVANPSSKATSVSIELWGTGESGRLTSQLGGNLTVAAHDLGQFDLSAAASGQDSLFVRVTSDQTPIAAVVRSSRAEGLTPKGSDYAMPLGGAATLSQMPGVRAGDKVRVLLFSRHDTPVSASWVTADGLSSVKDGEVEGDRVTVLDLGEAPEEALGVTVSSDEKVWASAVLTRSGQKGQEDFALIGAASAGLSSAVALPAGVSSTLTLSNMDNDEVETVLTFVGDDGAVIGRRRVTLPANGAVELSTRVSGGAKDESADGTASDGDGEDKASGEVRQAAAVVVEENAPARVAWSVRLTDGGLDEAKVAGISLLAPEPLAPHEAQVWSAQRPGLVR